MIDKIRIALLIMKAEQTEAKRKKSALAHFIISLAIILITILPINDLTFIIGIILCYLFTGYICFVSLAYYLTDNLTDDDEKIT